MVIYRILVKKIAFVVKRRCMIYNDMVHIDADYLLH